MPIAQQASNKKYKKHRTHEAVTNLSLFDNFNQIAYVIDPYTFEILFVNKYFEELLGKNPVGKKCYEVFQNVKHPCDFCTNKKILKNKDTPYEWEYHNPTLNKDFLITDRIIKWHDGRDVRFEFAIDVTELKHMKKQMKYQAELVDRVSDAIISTDTDFTIKSWNKAAKKIYGYSAKEAIGNDMYNLIDVEHIQKDRKKIANHILQKGYWKGEVIQKRKDGKLINIFSSINCIKDADGEFLGTVAVNRDSTQWHKMLEDLKKSEKRYKLAQRAGNIGSWDWNVVTGELVWSDRIEPMFGLNKGEFGKSYEEFLNCIHPEDRQYVLDAIKLCLKKDVKYDIEHRIIWPDSSVHWVRETGDVIRDKKSKAVRMVGIVQEITDQKKNEEKIKKLNEKLLQYVTDLTVINKELEAFSYSVSHDLRAPLRSIDGFSQALTEDYSDKLDEEGKDYLFRIRKATQHMGNIIDDLLKLSRITRQPLNIEKVNLGKLSNAIVDNLKKKNTQRKVKVSIDDDLIVVGDKQLLSMALENLIGNAWKFTSKTSNAKIEVGKTKNNKKDVFFVRDNGAGFNMKYVNKLFIPFQRLHSHEEFDGIGIGLGIVSRVIHRHGGEIWAEGTEGKGATFYFSFSRGEIILNKKKNKVI